MRLLVGGRREKYLFSRFALALLIRWTHVDGGRLDWEALR